MHLKKWNTNFKVVNHYCTHVTNLAAAAATYNTVHQLYFNFFKERNVKNNLFKQKEIAQINNKKTKAKFQCKNVNM